MRRRKRIVHISMRRRGECGGKVGIIGFFSGVKARVLQNANSPYRQTGQGGGRRLSDAIPGKSNFRVHQLPKDCCYGCQAQVRIGHTFGTPEMRQNTDPHAGRCQRFKRRQKPCKPRGIAQISRIVNRHI